MRPDLVAKPHRNGDEEANEVGNGDPLVLGTDREHVLGDGPSDGKGVELLNVLTRPDVGTED